MECGCPLPLFRPASCERAAYLNRAAKGLQILQNFRYAAPVRRRRVIFIILATCILVGIGVSAFWPGEKEPEYNGKKLSEWVRATGGYEGGGEAELHQAFAAVDHIGTSALPFLVKWIRQGYPTRSQRIAAFWWQTIEKVGIKRGHSRPDIPLNYHSAIVLGAFGTNASSVIPALIQVMRDPASSAYTVGLASYALSQTGEKGVTEVIRFVRDRDQSNRASGISSLASVEQNAAPALETLMECIEDPDEQVALEVTRALFIDHPETDKRVAILRKGASGHRARIRYESIQCLASYQGSKAAAAIPELTQALRDADAAVRKAATNLLSEIAPQVLTNGTTELSR